MKALLGAALLAYAVLEAVLIHTDVPGRDVWLLGGGTALWIVAVLAVRRVHWSPRRTAAAILGGGGVLQVIALTRRPLTSDDSFRYVWDGLVQLHGTDPYRYAPASRALAALRDPALFGPTSPCTYALPGGGCTAINRPEVHTIYPPVAQVAFDVVRVLSFGGTGGVRAFQVAAALGALAVAALLARQALRAGRPLWPVAIWAWCPVTVSEFGNNAHIDWLGVLLAVLALGAGARGHDLRAGVLAGLAVATKIYPALVVPSLLRRRPLRVVATVLAVVVLVYVPHVVAVGGAVIGYLPGYLNEEGYDSGSRFLLVPLPSGAALVVVALALAAVALWAWRRSDPGAPEQTATVMVGVALCLTTPSYGWYATLLIALVVMSRRWEWLPVTLAGSLAYDIRANPGGATAIWIVAVALAVIIWAVLRHCALRAREGDRADAMWP